MERRRQSTISVIDPMSRICQEKLAEADVKIQQLEKNAAGEPVLKPVNFADDSAAK